MSNLKRLVCFIAVSVVTTASFAQALQGDAKAGETKNAMCVGCHGIQGYKASFPEVYRVPAIAGQAESYLVAALKGYKTGERKHPSMRALAGSLSDQDMADLAAYYAQLGASATKIPDTPAVAPAATQAVLTKSACASCHGANYNKPIAPGYPKIAGQYADYIQASLKSYKDNSHATWGRGNGVMGGIAQQLTPAEIKLLAKYLSALPGDVKTVAQSKFR